MLQAKPTTPNAEDQYVSLGHISRKQLGMQAQYAARYVDGLLDDYPDVASDSSFGPELRVYGTEGDYHSYMIHQDDAEAFVSRIKQHRDTT